jgi:hypothetical protein
MQPTELYTGGQRVKALQMVESSFRLPSVQACLLFGLAGCVAQAAEPAPERPIMLADKSIVYYPDGVRDRLFEDIVWIGRPSASEVNRAFPPGRRAAAYANFRCEGFTARGELRDCRIDRSTAVGDPEIEPAALRLLQSFRVTPAYAAEQNPLLEWIAIRLQFRPRGSNDPGRCIENFWCVPTPAPPPPPPKK